MNNAVRLTGLFAVALALTAARASAAGLSVEVSTMPGHLAPGKTARLTVIEHPGGITCALRVRYANGATQKPEAPFESALGLSSWSWSWSWVVPANAAPGSARVDVHCGGAGSITRRFTVTGHVEAAPGKLVVEKSGFTTRPSDAGATRVSYGVIVHNPAAKRDASGVTVQTNFVTANNRLCWTDTQRVAGIAAGADFAVGNTVSLPGCATVVRLEFVVEASRFVRAALSLPTLADIQLAPELSSPTWLGTIDGELENSDPVRTLRLAKLSAVVFDADGAIVGGTNGSVPATLPPGARTFLQLSGLDVIPVDKAVSATVSVAPTWQP